MQQQIIKTNAWVLLKRHKKCLQAYWLNLACNPSATLGGWCSHTSTEQEKSYSWRNSGHLDWSPIWTVTWWSVFLDSIAAMSNFTNRVIVTHSSRYKNSYNFMWDKLRFPGMDSRSFECILILLLSCKMHTHHCWVFNAHMYLYRGWGRVDANLLLSFFCGCRTDPGPCVPRNRELPFLPQSTIAISLPKCN